MRAIRSVVIACALYLLLGLVTGNVLATGQAEPLRWLSASIYFAAVLAFFLKRAAADNLLWFSVMAAAFFSALAVLLFCGVAGQYWHIGHAALLGSVNFVLLVLFSLLFRQKRFAPLLLGLILLGGLMLPARLYFWPLQPAAQESGTKDALTIMTSLPIGPFGEKDVAAAFTKPADPIYTELSRTFVIDFADSLESRPRGRLLLAHPPALHPADLAAVDAWVRAGREVVILADPLLLWPGAHAPGHPRRPPVTSLLDPLLTHWGLRLEPALNPGGIVQMRLANGRLLAMAAPGRFIVTGKACRLEERGVIARCSIGRGGALLLADADMLHPSLWVGGDGNWPEIERDRPSDNLALLRQWLGAPERLLPSGTGWILTNRDICYGLVAGTAPILLLGALLCFLGRRVSRAGKTWEEPGKASL